MYQPLRITTDSRDIVLREAVPDDAEAIFRLIDENREHLSQWGAATPDVCPSLAAAHAILVRESRETSLLRLGIWHVADLIGSVFIQTLPAAYYAEIGYWLGKKYTGHGYMTIAAKALVSRAFDSGDYHCLTANAHRDNERSRRVLERIGFRKVSDGNEYVNYRLKITQWVQASREKEPL